MTLLRHSNCWWHNHPVLVTPEEKVTSEWVSLKSGDVERGIRESNLAKWEQLSSLQMSGRLKGKPLLFQLCSLSPAFWREHPFPFLTHASYPDKTPKHFRCPRQPFNSARMWSGLVQVPCKHRGYITSSLGSQRRSCAWHQTCGKYQASFRFY